MSLTPFGFTPTQDRVYRALLKRGAATGYAIGRDTGLARANVYQALDALVARGLAVGRGRRPVTYDPVPAAVALSILRGDVEQDLQVFAASVGVGDAVGESARLSPPAFETLTGARALSREATGLVDGATTEVLGVLGPWAEGVGAALDRATARRVKWRVVSLGAPAPEGAVIRTVPEAELTAYWGGLPVLLVADRSRAVCGVVTGRGADGVDTVHAGVVPFLRHLLRRELATAAAGRVS